MSMNASASRSFDVFPSATASEEDSSYEVEELFEEDDVFSEDRPVPQQSHRKIPAVLLIPLFGLTGLAAIIYGVGAGGAMKKQGTEGIGAPTTIRSLMEGQELTDVATDNIIALSRDRVLSKDSIEEHVKKHLQKVSSKLKEMEPALHKKLGEMGVHAKATKHALLRLKHKFQNKKTVDLTHAVMDVIKDNKGTRRELIKHLSSMIIPKLQKAEAMHQEIRLKVPAALSHWKSKLNINFGRPRTLTEVRAVDPSMRAQLHTFFRSLEDELGENMPAVSPHFEFKPHGALEADDPVDCALAAYPHAMDVSECLMLDEEVREVQEH